MAVRVAAEQSAPLAPLAFPAVLPRLMLPAPVRGPMMDALNALAVSPASRSAREPVPVAKPASRPADKSMAA